jgi:hypothetical protein
LEQYFARNTGHMIDKWPHYFEIYDRHLSRYRGTDVHLVEIGVYQGGSLQMWKDYFGPAARIYGVDINPHCKQLEEENISIIIGDQSDRRFLQRVASEIPRIDILIDDGGHLMKQQIATFEELFPRVDAHGVYLCEDMHTSYWKEYGGGYRRSGTFIEYSKEFVDRLHGWHSRQPERFGVSEFTRTTFSLHYYDSVLVIEKRPREAPFDLQTGQATVPRYDLNQHDSLGNRIRRMLRWPKDSA